MTGQDAGAGAQGPRAGTEPTEQELRESYEAELSRITTTDMLGQAAVSLLNVGARRLGAPSQDGGEAAADPQRDLEQVRDAVDGARALLEILERRITPQELGPLRDALKRPTLVGQQTSEQDLAEREVTVMGDKSLPYEVLKKVMRTCTDADYGRISLAVLQKDKPVPAGAIGRT